MCEAPNNKRQKNSVKKIILSDKKDNGKYFIGSCFHDHFQEAFRGLYHLHGHIRSKRDVETYNILIVPDTDQFDFILEEENKQKGIDQIWVVPFAKKYRWPFINSIEDAKVAQQSDNAITECLDQLDGMVEVVTKRPGPTKEGKDLLKFLLEPQQDPLLLNNRGEPLDGGYLALLLHTDDDKRAGLNTKQQFDQIQQCLSEEVRNRLLLIATTDSELKKAKEADSLPYVFLDKITSQAQFYKNHCFGVIGSNCSGCNIPALYNLPILTFVKERAFPDDFYCFARMASKYNKDSIPWNGELEKADNILEVSVPSGSVTSPSEYEERIQSWYIEFISKKVSKYSNEGLVELQKGFGDCCPNCKELNRSRQIQLVGTDFFVVYSCKKCETAYLSLRGLTSLSRRGISKVGSEDELDLLYQETCRLKQKYEKISAPANMLKEGINYSFDQSKKNIIFYCMKPSVSDLFYCLPGLYYLDKHFRHSYNIVAVVPTVYLDLIPKNYVDYLIPIHKNPFDYKNEVLSFVHCSLQHLIHESNGRVTSNIPGTLPYSPNLYRYFARLVFSEKREKSNDVVIFCRLRKDSRKWPSEEGLKELTSFLQATNIKYRLLVFPDSDKESLPDFFLRAQNVTVNPTLSEQLNLVSTSKVCVTPHGASEVLPVLANVPIIELETVPNWWKDKTPQPLRYGLSKSGFIKLEAEKLNDIPCAQILNAIEEFINE